MMFARYFVLFSTAALCGCSLFEPKPPKPLVRHFPKAHAEEAAVPKLVGIISMVNTDGQFVLIESNQSADLDPGVALKCLRDSVETGILAVGKERRRPYVTADIVKGTPQRGDQVFE